MMRTFAIVGSAVALLATPAAAQYVPYSGPAAPYAGPHVQQGHVLQEREYEAPYTYSTYPQGAAQGSAYGVSYSYAPRGQADGVAYSQVPAAAYSAGIYSRELDIATEPDPNVRLELRRTEDAFQTHDF